jgi:hypothetical protein
MSHLNKLFTFVSTLRAPVRYGGIGYLISAVLYTSTCCYSDSLGALNIFRNIDDKNHNKYCEDNNLKTEMDACKHGAYKNFGGHFFSSIIWPFSIASDIIPRIVLILNYKKNDK